MSRTTVSFELESRVAIISFVPRDERKPPTLDYELFDALEEILDVVDSKAAKNECRVAVFKSTSPKSFLAGANISVLKTLDERSVPEWIERGHTVLNRIEQIGIPTIARIHGFTLGGGLEFAMACDFIYAVEDAVVGQTEAKLGFVTGWGGSLRLVRRIGSSRAKELLMSGRMVDAEEAYTLGIVDFIGSAAEVEQRIAAFIESNAGCSAYAVGAMKRIIHSLSALDNLVLELERRASVDVMINGDTAERIREFLEKRKK